MGVSSSESHDLTAFYEMLSASFGVLSQNTGFYPSLDRIIETTLGPLNLGPGGRSYNEPISRLHRQLGNVLFGGHSKVLLLLMLRVLRLKLSSAVRARLRPGMYHILVLAELQWICGTGTQGDRSLLNALSRKCYMHMLQYVHRGTLP